MIPLIHTRCDERTPWFGYLSQNRPGIFCVVKARKYAASRATHARRGELAEPAHRRGDGGIECLCNRLQVVPGLCVAALVVCPRDGGCGAHKIGVREYGARERADRRVDDEEDASGQRERCEVFSCALSPGRIPERQDGDVSAEASAECGELRAREPKAPEVVERDEGCGCICASPTEAAADWDALAQDDICAFIVRVGCFQQSTSCAEHEVIRTVEIGEGDWVDEGEWAIAEAREGELGIVAWSDMQFVAVIKDLKGGLYGMIAIGTTAGYVKE